MTTISMENVNQDANAAGPAREAFNGERCQEELRADHVFRDAIESAGMLVKISAGPIGIIAEFLDSETLKNTTEMNNEPNKPFTFEKLKREKKLIQRLAFVDENYANDRPKRNKELAKIVNET